MKRLTPATTDNRTFLPYDLDVKLKWCGVIEAESRLPLRDWVSAGKRWRMS